MLCSVELVTNLQESSALWRDVQGCWQAQDIVSWSKLPAKTEAIIAERIGRLPQTLRQLLRVASVQGETFVAELVAQVLQRPLPEIIRLLSGEFARSYRLVQAVGRQQVGTETISRYRFRHSLFQQYVYGRLDAIERAQLHQTTGEALLRLYEAANLELMSIAAELAYHFDAAQVVARAVYYHQLAGEHALRLSAQAEAINHYRRSLALLATLPETAGTIRQKIDGQLALGAALLAIQGYASPEV